jgi:hypothetical protein
MDMTQKPNLSVIYNENPLTDIIDGREKFMHAYEGSRLPYTSALH